MSRFEHFDDVCNVGLTEIYGFMFPEDMEGLLRVCPEGWFMQAFSLHHDEEKAIDVYGLEGIRKPEQLHSLRDFRPQSYGWPFYFIFPKPYLERVLSYNPEI